MIKSSEEYPTSREKNNPRFSNVQSYKVGTAIHYRFANLGNLQRNQISIGFKVKSYIHDGNMSRAGNQEKEHDAAIFFYHQ